MALPAAVTRAGSREPPTPIAGVAGSCREPATASYCRPVLRAPVVPLTVDLIHPRRAKPFHRPGWVYEEKYDGWRIVAFKDGSRVRLVSRRGRDHTARFPNVATAIARLSPRSLILDGEICVFDAKLVSQFHLLIDPGAELATPPVFIGVRLSATTLARSQATAIGARRSRT